MATLVTNSTAQARNPVMAAKGSSTVFLGGGYCFYGDNPESVTNGDLVDGPGKRWLNKATVTGAGIVYLWHTNGSGAPFKHALLIYNPNNFPIRVSSANNGLTKSTGSDVSGWTQYFAGNTNLPTPKVIPATSFGTIFQQDISAGQNFGIVARTNVVNDSTGAAASAIFYDVAYLSTNIGATDWATIKSPTMRRGLAQTYYNTINFAEIAPTDSTNGVAYSICGSEQWPGVFGTADIPTVTDYAPAGNNVTGLLAGGYGQQYAITMNIRNNLTTNKNFRIMIGKTPGSTGSSFPLVNMAGVTQYYQWGSPGSYFDMIDTGPVAAGALATVSFFMTVPAVSSTPVIIGARVAS